MKRIRKELDDELADTVQLVGVPDLAALRPKHVRRRVGHAKQRHDWMEDYS